MRIQGITSTPNYSKYNALTYYSNAQNGVSGVPSKLASKTKTEDEQEEILKKGDSVEISEEGKQKAKEEQEKEQSITELSDEEQSEVQKLTAIDAEVKAHESAHLGAAGSYAKGISLEYEKGPDGKRYAVAGEVGIDTSTEDTPEKTVHKMQRVMQAALAPAKPSGQDRSVASAASKAMAAAQVQLSEEKSKEARGESEDARKDVKDPIQVQPQLEIPNKKGNLIDISG